MDQQLKDLRVARDRANYSDSPNYGLLVLAAAVDRVAQAINGLEIRIVTKKPEGL